MGDDVSKNFFGSLPEAPWKKGEENKMLIEDDAEGIERRAAIAKRHSYKYSLLGIETKAKHFDVIIDFIKQDGYDEDIMANIIRYCEDRGLL